MSRLARPLLAALGILATGAAVAAEDLDAAIARDYDACLEALFEQLHAHPELSHREYRTAARSNGGEVRRR